MSEIQTTIADLRRKGDALHHAADVLEQEYGRDELEEPATTPAPDRWGPGQGAQDAVKPRSHKKKVIPAPGDAVQDTPAPPQPRRTRQAPPLEPDEEHVAVPGNVMRQIVHCVKEVAAMIGDRGMTSPHLTYTVINYLPGRKLPHDAETVAEAIAIARQEGLA